MLKIIAHLFSYLFHPLLTLTYLLLLTMWVNPYLFGHTTFQRHSLTLVQIFFSTALLPALAMLLMWRLNLLSSLAMTDKQERIGPYIATGIFYLWIFVNVRENGEIPLTYRAFVLAATIALFLSFLMNLIERINIHAVSAGVQLSAVIAMFAFYQYTLVNMTLVLMAAIILAGTMGTAQLLLRKARPAEIYGGYFIGFVSQGIALYFML